MSRRIEAIRSGLVRFRMQSLPGLCQLYDLHYDWTSFWGAGHRGVTDGMLVSTEEPRWVAPAATTGGRPRKRHRLAEGSPRPVSLKELAARAPRRKVTWREGATGPRAGPVPARRAWPGPGWASRQCAGAGPACLRLGGPAEAQR